MFTRRRRNAPRMGSWTTASPRPIAAMLPQPPTSSALLCVSTSKKRSLPSSGLIRGARSADGRLTSAAGPLPAGRSGAGGVDPPPATGAGRGTSERAFPAAPTRAPGRPAPVRPPAAGAPATGAAASFPLARPAACSAPSAGGSSLPASRDSVSLAASLSSGRFPEPHLGDWMHEGHPSSHGHPSRSSSVRAINSWMSL